MILYNKAIFVYDIEVFPNVFMCAVKNSETKGKRCYEISDRKNDLPLIWELFHHKKIIFCGYNNHHYDDAIIAYLLIHYEDLIKKPVWEITSNLKKLSDTIITSSDGNTNAWKTYKYAKLFPSMDLLTMLFSSKLRVGLKELQVTMEYKNVQEYEGDFNAFLPIEEIDKAIMYNYNDVDSTDELLTRLTKAIELRKGIIEEYGVDVMSSDGVSIGKEILKTRYLQDTGKTWAEIKDLRSPCKHVAFKDIIIPSISYETKQLQDLLEEMKGLVIDPDEGWGKTFDFFGTIISMSVGGIHSINKPEIVEPAEDEKLVDWDAASLYPSLLIEWGFYPQHLGKEFLNTYSNIKKERIEAKHNGNKIKNETLKLTLNSVTGLMQNEYSWLYSPKDVLKIRMNGQLLLLKLAEMLILATGCRVIQYNTDGIFVLIKTAMLEKAEAVIKEFEKLSRLQMEGEEFEAFYQYAINDYIAVHKGYKETHNPKLIKTKGLFIDQVSLGKGMAPQIIAECLKEYFVNKVPVNQTLMNCTDIRKFLTYQKVKKEFAVEYAGKLITHINRYYMSTNGYKLRKCVLDPKTKVPIKYTDICASSAVTIVNELTDIDVKTAHINYAYYRNEIYKIIYALEDSLNTTLF